MVALSGSAEVLKRISASRMRYWPKARRLPVVKSVLVELTLGEPLGGYPDGWLPVTWMSPSSPPAATLKVTVVSPAPITVAVWAEAASLEPALLLAVTTARRLAPTSAATTE